MKDLSELRANLRCLCDNDSFETLFTYSTPPEIEVRYPINYDNYYREIVKCTSCGHLLNLHTIDLDSLYQSDYVNSTYQDENGLRQAFERIANLPPDKSDNTGRVKRILDHASVYLKEPADKGRQPRILDVGSGLCVFLHRMKEAGWDCTALDTDPRQVRHAVEVVGVQGIQGSFMEVGAIGSFDVITFNKVLEHMKDPIPMLTHSANFLNKGGFVYLELPDGEAAMADGAEREEFTVEHYHVFTTASLWILAQKAGFHLHVLERLREPSTKYTLRAFLTN